MNKSNTELQVEIGEANVLFEWASSILKQLKTITEKEKDRNVEVFLEKTKTLNYHVHEFCKSMDEMLNPNGGTGPEALLKKKKRAKPGDENKNGMNDGGEQKNDGKEQKNDGKGKGKNDDGKGTSAGKKPGKEIGEFLTEAHADFSQSNLNGIQAKNVEGVRLPDGNFIFVWRDEGYKKLVLTDNQGDVLKAGYARDAVPGWDNPATWTPSGVEGRWGYTVTNFNGVAKGDKGSGSNNATNQAGEKDDSKTGGEMTNQRGGKDGPNANQQGGKDDASSFEGGVSNQGDGKAGFIINDDGSIAGTDGSIIGTVGRDGVIVGKDGSVIGTLQKDGWIMGKDGSVIGSELGSSAGGGMAQQRGGKDVSFQNSETAKLLGLMGPEQIEYSYGISEDKMHEFYSKQRMYLWLIG